MASSEITEELTSGQRTTQNLSIETPLRTQEEAKEDFLRINIPLTPSPRRVLFSPCASPGFIPNNESPGSSSSRNRPTLKKSLIPKLSFKFKNTASEIEKAAFLALEGSSTVSSKKPFLSRTLSRIKLKGRKTSSLPVSPVPRSNPASVHGGKGYPAMASVSILATLATCYIGCLCKTIFLPLVCSKNKMWNTCLIGYSLCLAHFTGERTAVTNSSFAICSCIYRRRYFCWWQVSNFSDDTTIERENFLGNICSISNW